MGGRKEWGEGSVPPVCVLCGTNESKHQARGLCNSCYPKVPRGSHIEQKDGDDDMVDGQASFEDVGDDVPALPVDDPLGGRGVGQDADPLAVPGSRERRPSAGGGSPSLSSDGDAPRARGRLSRLFGSKPKATGTAPVTKEKAPKGKVPRGRRQSGAETLSDAWGGIGSFVGRTPGHVPLGRYMQFQAPVAGEMLDEAAAGTIIDKMALQPIIRARGKFDLVAAVFGPPALILAIERNPGQGELLVPMLRSSIRNALPLMVPAIKRIQAKEAKTLAAADDLFDDDADYRAYCAQVEATGGKPDPAEYILSMIFSGWAPAAPVPESEAVNSE
jgi:hypothetical protein